MTAAVLLYTVQPSSQLYGAGGAVNASMFDDVERAITGSSTVVLWSRSLVTRSVVESVPDFELSGVVASSSAGPVIFAVAVVSPSADVNAVWPKVERLSVASSPHYCGKDVTAAMGLVNAAVQSEGWLCFLNKLM